MARTRTGSGVTKRRAGRLAARTAFWREARARPARLRAAAVSRAPAAACFGRAAGPVPAPPGGPSAASAPSRRRKSDAAGPRSRGVRLCLVRRDASEPPRPAEAQAHPVAVHCLVHLLAGLVVGRVAAQLGAVHVRLAGQPRAAAERNAEAAPRLPAPAAERAFERLVRLKVVAREREYLVAAATA